MGFVLSAASSIVGGFAQKSQSDAEAAQYEQNAKNAITAGDQADYQRRTDLNSTLSAINAMRASRGLEVTSPTGMAIAADRTDRAEKAIDQSNLNYRQQSQSNKTQAGISRSQGRAALIGGFLKGGASLFQGAAQSAALAG